MTDQQTRTRPAWVVWLRVGGIIAALGAVVTLYGFISQSLAPVQAGQVLVAAGLVTAAAAGIWRVAAGRR